MIKHACVSVFVSAFMRKVDIFNKRKRERVRIEARGEQRGGKIEKNLIW